MRRSSGHLVVIDTNCLLQMLGRHSIYRALWEAFLQEHFVWCVSNEILNEYEEILAEKASPRVAYLFMQTLLRSPNVLRKDPYFHFQLIEKDKDDNKFVDCAVVSCADYIVSEDAHFRVLENVPFPEVKVIKLDDFLNYFSHELYDCHS